MYRPACRELPPTGDCIDRFTDRGKRAGFAFADHAGDDGAGMHANREIGAQDDFDCDVAGRAQLAGQAHPLGCGNPL